MARSRYIKTYSNYVIKDIHQTTNIGTIYERDFMTISDLNSYAPGSLPAYGLNGFKMVVNDGVNLKKKHRYGTWLKNNACGIKSQFWTLNCQDGDDDFLLKNGLTLKTNKTSLLDYVCFGSANKLVESTVRFVIDNFPGEVFLTDREIVKGYFYVDNPFEIEFSHVYNGEKNILPLRMFSKSYDDYYIIGGDVASTVEWNQKYERADTELGYINDFVCRKDGKLMTFDLGEPKKGKKLELYYFILNGKRILLHNGEYKNCGIRPKMSVVNKFFNELEGFNAVLLNRKTNYTAVLDTPKETENGNVMYKMAYTWPRSQYGNWNLDVISSAFYRYFDSLLNIGDFYDKFHTDNIWRSMTHEAIVNFDWTLSTVNSEGQQKDYDSPESERIKAFIHVAGRTFDEIKLYIDGIAYANSVTFNENDNAPDYFLPDLLCNYGWDVKNVIPYKYNKYVSYPLYPSHVDGYTTQDAVYEFYRRLLLSSRAILSAKGTKRSIEMVLALFGYHSSDFIRNTLHEINGEQMTYDELLKLRTDLSNKEDNNRITALEEKKLKEIRDIVLNTYEISEFVHIAEPSENAQFVEEVKNLNQQKLSYDVDDEYEMQGIPVEEVVLSNGNSYLIPWFDKKQEYDGGLYFEAKGGWGEIQSKVVEIDGYNEFILSEGENLKIYDETVKYLKFVENIEDLLTIRGEYPKVNDVYYVYNIAQQNLYDWGYVLNNDNTPENHETMSHYFILKNEKYDDVLGVLRDKDGVIIIDNDGTKQYGWKNISETELNLATSDDAKRIFYIESILETNTGNNPHCGFGDYDGGDTYKAYFEDIFKGVKTEDSFIDVDDSFIKDLGFKVETQEDNVKTKYFSDEKSDDDEKYLRLNNSFPNNFEGGSSSGEAAAYSIINTKLLSINFVPDMVSPESMYNFIADGAMHYVKQVIPSTTILKYHVPIREISTYCANPTCIQSARIIK